MRIAYLVAWRGGDRTGPFKKMAAQSEAWSHLGHEVGLFVTTSGDAKADWQQLRSAVRVETSAGTVGGAVRSRRRLYRAVETWRPEIVYLRHGLFAPGLRRVVRRFPTVIEVNGNDIALAHQSSAAKGAWAAATRSLVLRRVVGGVFMTSELATSPRFASYGFDCLVVPNGIDLAATPHLPPNNTGPGVVLLAHPHSPWHGTDKLVALARSHPDWRVDVIGPTMADLRVPAPGNLTLHPEMSASEYLPILAKADVGIGSLAMHRLGIDENPALKVREYLALGLAVLSGCHDPDIPASAEYVLQLPNTETSVIDRDSEITSFVNAWHGRRVDRSQITYLDLAAKERERLAFFSRLIVDGPQSGHQDARM